MEAPSVSPSSSSLHIAMYPWFAFGHITPFLHLANQLANKGHRISFLVPQKTKAKIHHLNRFPHLITFVPITVPHVDGLPPGAETTHDVPSSLIALVMTAMDRTQNDIEILLRQLQPHLVFFDFVYWLPKMARSLGIKSLYYSAVSAVTTAYSAPPSRRRGGLELSEAELMRPPPGFPDSSINLHLHEARASLEKRFMKFGGDILFFDRWFMSLNECEAIGFKACKEIDGPFIDYIKTQFGKPLLLSGPLIPSPPTSALEAKWVEFLGRFKAGSVIYCCFGSEATLTKDQFQELLLGFELSGRPFLAALRQPSGVDSIGEALPDGFEERVRGRGMVHGGWIQQQQILAHPSVGCNVTHCGWGSLFEALVNQCELVLLPILGDQIFNARLMGNSLKVGVEVQKGEEDGLFTKESVCNAIRTVMEEEYSEVGRQVRANRANLREFLLREDLESSYIDEFSHKLQTLVG